MAARSPSDTAVSERRLRPIYDYLDNGNNKKALQEAEKLIKKHKDPKDVLCARALKALALIRLTRQEEALAVIKEVHSEGPTDDATLQAMTICYREVQKPELIANAYEIATKKDPQNEELLTHLFMSYVRTGEYKKQQQTAMALFKLKPKNPYYFWAVMSIVMQANSCEDKKLAKSMLLPLAERMAVKFVNEDRIEAEAEVELYLMILELQEKYQEAYEVLGGPLKEKLSGYLDFLPKKQAELLSKMERWPEATIAFKKLILSNPDQWSYYMEYFEALTHLIDSKWEPDEKSAINDVDYKFEHAIDLLSTLIDEQNNAADKILRGPYLAQIELLQQLLSRKDPLVSKIGSLVDKIVSFYEKFSSKPSCYMDIAHVISSVTLNEDEKNELLTRIKGILFSDGMNNSLPIDLKSMYKHLCYCQLCLYLGYYENWSDEQKLDFIYELAQRYRNGLELCSKLLPTEYHPCDNYCLLSAYIIIDLWHKSGNERLIVHAIYVIEEGLQRSPSNFIMKLLLIKLYNAIGAVGLSFYHYESIDVKHIQQETLGYVIIEPLLVGAFFTTTNVVLGNSIRFFIGNHKDTVDYLIACYKFGSFVKIPEIVCFRKKLNNSLNYAYIKVEKIILDCLLEVKSQQDIEKVIAFVEQDFEKDKSFDEVTDNRDISILRLWNCKDKPLVEDQVEKTFTETISWVKIRIIMVKFISTIFTLTKSSIHINNSHHNEITNGEKHNISDALSNLISNFKDLVDSIDVNSLVSSSFPIQAPGPTRLLRYIQGNYLDIFISLVELVLNLHRLAESSADAEEKSCLKVISDSRKLFQALLKRMESVIPLCTDAVKPTQTKTILEDFTNAVEIISLSAILISSSHALLKPARSSAMRKGKKKKETVLRIASEVFQQLDILIDTIEGVGESLLDLLNRLDLSLLTSCLTKLALCDMQSPAKDKSNSKINTGSSIQLQQKVLSSYQNSVKELSDILQMKVKYLQSLKW